MVFCRESFQGVCIWMLHPVEEHAEELERVWWWPPRWSGLEDGMCEGRLTWVWSGSPY